MPSWVQINAAGKGSKRSHLILGDASIGRQHNQHAKMSANQGTKLHLRPGSASLGRQQARQHSRSHLGLRDVALGGQQG